MMSILATLTPGAAIAAAQQFIQDHFGLSSETQIKLFKTLLALLVVMGLRWVLARMVQRRIKDLTRRYLTLKSSSYAAGLLGLLLLARIWLGGQTGLAAYFGLLSAGLAIALQDPLTNLAGWLFITFRKPFAVGDRIQIGAHAGDVIDLRLFQFTILEIGNWVQADQSTGRIIHIPNGWAFKQPLANYTQGFNFIWHEIPVIITFESNWAEAKKRMLEIGQRHSVIQSEHAAKEVQKAARKFLIFFNDLTPIVWTSTVPHGIQLTLRYLCEPRRRRSTETAIWEDLLREFAARPDLDFAYPTTRFYQSPAERAPGKPGTSAPGG